MRQLEQADLNGEYAPQCDPSVWRTPVQAAGQRAESDHIHDCFEYHHGEYSQNHGIPVSKIT